jgi:tRNA threonylcarbamoyladenosine biosynthesis protein TsaE
MNKIQFHRRCESESDTKSAAEFFSRIATPGQCFALHGDLGSGKTTFCRYFIKSLNPSIEDAPSPTFTIIQIYEGVASGEFVEIWHADCYRLNDVSEFFQLGLDEAIQNCITLIEWPEIIRHMLPKNTVDIRFSIDPKSINVRIIETVA